jgi:hypothetical protein
MFIYTCVCMCFKTLAYTTYQEYSLDTNLSPLNTLFLDLLESLILEMSYEDIGQMSRRPLRATFLFCGTEP